MLWWTLRQLRSSHEEVRLRAIQQLGRSKHPRAIDALVTALRDDGFPNRSAVAEALGETGAERAVEALRGHLEHAGPGAKKSVLRALARIGGDDARDALIWALDETSSCGHDERKLAAQALVEGGLDRIRQRAQPALRTHPRRLLHLGAPRGDRSGSAAEHAA